MRDLVSVTFPVGPDAHDAETALQDLLDQTWKSLEIIVVLNGFPVEVRELFHKYHDSRLKVIDHGKKGDLLKALNEAVKESLGKWLSLLGNSCGT